MVEALPSVLALGHKRNSSTPAFLTSVLRNIIISLARLPLVNSYTRVPPLVSLVTPWRKTEVNEMRGQAPGWGPLGGREQTWTPQVLPLWYGAFRGVRSRHLSDFLGRGVQQSVAEMLGFPKWGEA